MLHYITLQHITSHFLLILQYNNNDDNTILSDQIEEETLTRRKDEKKEKKRGKPPLDIYLLDFFLSVVRNLIRVMLVCKDIDVCM